MDRGDTDGSRSHAVPSDVGTAGSLQTADDVVVVEHRVVGRVDGQTGVNHDGLLRLRCRSCPHRRGHHGSTVQYTHQVTSLTAVDERGNAALRRSDHEVPSDRSSGPTDRPGGQPMSRGGLGAEGSDRASATLADVPYGTRGRSSMVEPQSSKLATRVRFPSPAPRAWCRSARRGPARVP